MKKLPFLLLFSMVCYYGTSQVDYIDRIYQGIGGVEGIIAPSSIAISPDDKNVYIIGNKQSIAIFDYNKQFEDLEYKKSIKEGENGVNGIYGIFQMNFSPEGKFAYAVSIDSSSIIVFERDTSNGNLEIIQKIKNNNSINCLLKPSNILLTKNGKFAYSVSQPSNKIGVFNRDQVSGYLTFVDSIETYFSGYENPTGYYISISDDSKNLYSTSYRDRKIISYQIDPITGTLSKIQELDNNDLFGYYYSPNTVILSPNGRFAYAPCYDNRIILLQRDTGTGILTPIEVYDLDEYSNIIGTNSYVNNGIVSKDSKFLFATIDLSDVVVKLEIDSTSGSISADTIIYKPNCTINPYNQYLGDKTISLSNDEKMVFAVSSYDDNVMVIGNNIGSKGLNLINTFSYGDNGLKSFNEPMDFVIADNGKYVYAISGLDSTMHSFSRDTITGTLINQNKVIKSSYLGSSNCRISLSNDNKNIYVCTYASTSVGSSVSVILIDTLTGNFNLQQILPNNDSGSYGALRFYDIACSKDDRNVYTISEHDILKIYSRDLSTGMLTFKDNMTIQPIGAATYFNANRILISNDNKFVYLVSDQGIKVLSRNENGLLSNIQTINCTDNYWGYASDAKFTDDQSSLFILNGDAPYLAEYSRNSSTGLLEFSQVFLNQDEPELFQVRSLYISKNKKYIYIGAAPNSNIFIVRLNPNNNIYEKQKIIEGITLDRSVTSISKIKATSDERSIYMCSFNDKTIANYRPKLNLGNDIKVCTGEKVILSSHGNYNSYNWSTGGTSDTISVSVSGTYHVTVTNGFGETEIDSVYVYFYPLPIVDLGEDSTICNGDTIMLSSDKDFESYLWNTGSTSKNIIVYNQNEFSITVTDSLGCSNMDSVSINFYPISKVDLGKDSTICNGDTIMLSSDKDFENYLWNTGATSKNILAYIQAEYSITVIDSFGCSIKDTVSISLHPLPNLIVSDVSLCYGSTVDILASGCFSYVWDNDSTGEVLTVNPPESTSYSVTGTDTNNCSVTKDIIATVYPIPATPLVIEKEDSLISSSPIGNQWYLNDTMLIGDTSQFITHFEKGNYFVIVTINECASDTSNVIHVLKSNLNEYDYDLLFKIYPNPTKDKITLMIPKHLLQGNLTILNLNGTELLKRQIVDSEMKLDLSILSEGIYFIKLKKDNKTLIRKLIRN